MPYTQVALALSANQARSGADGSAQLINCYAEDTGTDAKAKWTLYPSAGLDLWTTVQQSGSGGIKAMLKTESYLYIVCGRKVTAIDVFGVKTVVLTLAADGDVYMARNRRNPSTQVCLVDSTSGVAYIIVNLTVTAITDPDLPPPVSVSVIDGYFILPTTYDRVFISGEDDGLNYAPLDFGKAQKQPDNTLYALGGERDAMIFGTNTVEWWTDSPDGLGNFPFTPIEVMNLGCSGAKTVVQLDRAFAWLASDGTVRLRDGYSGRRISSYYIERRLASVTASTISGFGWTEKDTGHAFLAWTCPSFTVVYAMRTGKWHERQSFARTNWRGSQSIEWQGMLLIGDYQDGRVYRCLETVSTEGGEPILMTCIPPIINAGLSGFILDEIAVDALTGVGTLGPLAQDIDPVLMVSTSDDGGLSYGLEREISLGRSGQRTKRLRALRFGKFGQQGCTLKLSCSASVSRALSSLEIKARPLTT